MSIIIKTYEEIQKIRIASRIAAKTLEFIKPYIVPGISTEKLNLICHNHIVNSQKAFPGCLNYHGFPKSICTSVNNTVCHGIPRENEILRSGDIINIDVTVIKNGFYGDTSKMFFVGKKTKEGKKLCKVAKDSLYLAIKMVRPGIRLQKIGKSIQDFIEKNKFSVVKEYCGHGIGKKFHEDPQILHYNAYDGGITLKEGMIFTIEPMVNFGKDTVELMEDGWTVKTKDNKLSAQYEHTLSVTKHGCEILTLREEERFN
ncbi:methionine aminopeptidase [Candidatus Riesia sp. GBBU]|nr:methionine aminopeptidase [Candidatus Riesia sp. GBBU]